jgi:hypothetical protein
MNTFTELWGDFAVYVTQRGLCHTLTGQSDVGLGMVCYNGRCQLHVPTWNDFTYWSTREDARVIWTAAIIGPARVTPDLATCAELAPATP